MDDETDVSFRVWQSSPADPELIERADAAFRRAGKRPPAELAVRALALELELDDDGDGGDFGPRLSEEAIAGWERQHGVRLPVEYRLFLLHIGDGGAEFLPLRAEDLSGQDQESAWLRGPELSDSLRRPFPFVEKVTLDVNNEALLRRSCDGCLALSDEGCSQLWVLIVTGRAAGQVWWSDGLRMEPRASDFLAWLFDSRR